LSGGVCSGCGYGRSKQSTSTPVDPRRHLCCHEDRGQLCTKPGALSSSTHGAGPWYCADHFPPLRSGSKSTPPGGFESLRGLTKRVAPVLPAVDFEAIAERQAIEQEGRP